MAINSGTILTKYIKSATIITTDVANMWYGGLFGTTEGALYDVDHPLVAGHTHDGEHQDGHAQKIDLVNHVTGQVRNSNLADDAVVARNVQSFLSQGSAIPEFEVISGTTYYNLDLSDLRSTIANNGAFEVSANITSNSPGALTLDDFVFGSDSLDDDGDVNHDNRFIFDKSKGAFRSGSSESTEWDDINRGINSTSFGRNNKAIGIRTTIAGGDANTISGIASQSFIGGGSSNGINGINSFVGSGLSNVISISERAAIVSGDSNTIAGTCDNSFIGSGNTNAINLGSSASVMVGGTTNTIDVAIRGVIVGGISNVIGDGGGTTSTNSFIGAGNTNIILGQDAVLVGGNTNAVGGDYSALVGGESNVISVSSASSFIGGGKENILSGKFGVIVGGGGTGLGNTITSTGLGGEVIVGGLSNSISATGVLGGSMILGGLSNGITGAGDALVIAGGATNTIDESSYSIIVGGDTNSIDNGSRSAIVGGESNTITGTVTGSNHSFIGGGSSNTIDSVDSDASYCIIHGGESNTIEASVAGFSTFSADHSSIGGGQGNVINDSNFSVINGGLFNQIDAPTVGFPANNFSVIRGGALNRVDLNGGMADAGGLASRAYMYNQFAHGGGYWPSDVDAGGLPSPFGQAQTSVIVASGTVSAGDVATQLFTNLFASTGTLYVPQESCVFCEVTWVARDSSATGLVSGGKYSATLKRDAGAAILVSFNTDTSYSEAGLSSVFSLVGGVLGLVVPFITVSGSGFPARVVAKVEWTQVYLSN